MKRSKPYIDDCPDPVSIRRERPITVIPVDECDYESPPIKVAGEMRVMYVDAGRLEPLRHDDMERKPDREKKDRPFLKRLRELFRVTIQGYIGGMTLLAWWPWVLGAIGAFLVVWRLMK